MRRCFAAALWLPLLLAGCGGDGGEPLARNLLLISIDTLRPDRLGCYGHPRDTSPHLDALCRESVVFEQAISHAPSTLPAHASMLTSVPPQVHGASISRRSPVPDELVTLAEVLKERGFRTVSFNDGAQLRPLWKLGQGFDLYRSTRGKNAVKRARFTDRVDDFLGWLDDHDEGEAAPFFAFLHSYEVHHPYDPTEEDLGRFEERRYEGWLGRQVSVQELRRINRGEAEAGPAEHRFVLDAYDAEIRSMDRALGRLLASLRERGLLERTLVVFTSDHGEEMGEHGSLGWHAHTLYDELLRIPLVVRFPDGRWAERRVRRQVRLIDVAPTALAALGVEAPPDWWGVDLARLLGDDEVEPLVAVAMIDHRADPPAQAVRTGRWKWIRGRLFDLANDPGETLDVFSAHREMATALAEHASSVWRSAKLGNGETVVLDEDATRELEALGYL